MSVHGIIYAFLAQPELNELVAQRTAASLPIGCRYRLIDFAMSSLMNARAGGAGVIMQRDYQSLLDHLGSGKDWDMSRRRGGLRLLPPFGLAGSAGQYQGCMDALAGVYNYIADIPETNIALLRGDLLANLDLNAAMETHRTLGTDITAICTASPADALRHRFELDKDGYAENILCNVRPGAGGIAPLEAYIIKKSALLELIQWCSERRKLHFHRDAMTHYLSEGNKLGVYMHEGYALPITNTRDYYAANMALFDPAVRRDLFPAERPVRSKSHEEVSTYYGENSRVRNSLVADGCIIEGELHNCVVFSGARVARGASLEGCILMRGCRIEKGVIMRNCIADKHVSVSENSTLSGSEALPIIIPKGSTI